MDLNRYWADVRAVMDELPRQRIYYLVSVENSDKGTVGGRVMDLADPKQVAKMIVGKTHTLASEEQIAQFLREQDEAALALAKIEMGKKGQLAMPQELQDLVKLAARGALSEQQQSNPPAPPATPKKEK